MNEILKKRIEEAAKNYANENAWYPGETSYESDIIAVEESFTIAFRDGAEYALSHQWISVEDALPECSAMVFVKDKYGNYDIAYLSKKGYWISNDGKEIVVSFWMPIPKFETNEK